MQDWVKELTDKYSSAIAVAFVLHLNVFDYVEPGGGTIRNYLCQLLSDRKIIAIYNRAEGITFALPSQRQSFIDINRLQPDPITGEVELPKAPSQALPLLEQLLKYKVSDGKASAVIIEYAESLVPAADMAMMMPADRDCLVMMERWGRDPDITAAGNPVILITANLGDLHEAVRTASSKYECIRVPMPRAETRLEYIEMQKKANDTLKWEIDPGSVARSTAGLSLINIEDIFLRARQEGKITWALITERKKEIMRSEFGEVLEMVEPQYGFEAVGGLEHVKEFFRKSIVEPMRKGNYGRVPMGVLMTGPAGTGKTIMAFAVAKESGINMAILNPAKIFSKWVGESERNLDRALEAIDSLSPVLVFTDEIDQAMQRGEAGDSGVSNRVFKRLLEFMSDTAHRGRVVMLAATNRPDLLDAALKRPGRFDTKIPFLVPDGDSRLDILAVMAKKYGLPLGMAGKAAGDFQEELKARTEGWTGAEIEKVAIKAKALVEDRKIKPQVAILEALKLVRARTANIEEMSRLAIADCDDLEFIPEKYRTKEGARSA